MKLNQHYLEQYSHVTKYALVFSKGYYISSEYNQFPYFHIQKFAFFNIASHKFTLEVLANSSKFYRLLGLHIRIQLWILFVYRNTNFRASDYV